MDYYLYSLVAFRDSFLSSYTSVWSVSLMVMTYQSVVRTETSLTLVTSSAHVTLSDSCRGNVPNNVQTSPTYNV